jgi:hypothetical protein
MGYDNPFDATRSGIMANYLKALQAYSAVQQIKNDAEDRKFRQENQTYERGINERQFSRAEANDKFNRDKYNESQAYGKKKDSIGQALEMAQVGATPISNVGDFWFSQNKGSFVPDLAQDKSGYKLPSYQQQSQRTLAEVVKKGQLAVANKILEAQALLPYDVAKSEGAARARSQYAQPPAPRFVQTDAAGMGIDPRTGQAVWSNPGLAKPKTEGNQGTATAKVSIEKIEGAKGDAQQALKLAQYWQTQIGTNPDAQDNYYKALATAKAKEEEAKGLAANLKKMFPNNFNYTVDKDNNIAVDWRD